jgi:prepilin-type N-terminal cleavage/methylation domain-containing protein
MGNGSCPHFGFTLIEAIATIVVLGVIASVSSGIILSAADGYLGATVQAQLHTELSVAMDRIVRELQKIDLDESASGVAPDVDTFTSTTIAWSNPADENSALWLDGTDLKVIIDDSDDAVLLADVVSVAFAASDESDASLALPLAGPTCDAIRRITVTITLTRSGETSSLRSNVFLRSTMSGAE